jgi:hypothetical protein
MRREVSQISSRWWNVIHVASYQILQSSVLRFHLATIILFVLVVGYPSLVVFNTRNIHTYMFEEETTDVVAEEVATEEVEATPEVAEEEAAEEAA